MLSRLSIQNYAIIDRLEIDFSANLNIITGETGAGKSIIVGALGLILGQRAESNVLLNREKKCIVEGCFREAGSDEAVVAFLREHELDQHEELVVRREIAASGKSRAFINDTPVNLSQLHALSSLLVDLHQQFDTLSLGESDFQREVLDALATQGPLVRKYGHAYAQMMEKRSGLQALKEEKARFEKELDYHQFQFNELEEAGLRPNELEDMEAELRLLTHAEGIKNALARASYELEEGETPLLRQLKGISSSLQPFADYHKELPALVQRLQSVYIELQDIADETGRLNDHIASDAARIDTINERMATGYRLLKKHGVQTTAELLDIQEGLSRKLGAVLNIDAAISATEKAYGEALAEAEKLAGAIAAGRAAQVKPLEEQVNQMLSRVGMPNARIRVSISRVALNATGFDAIEFLFDANKSNQFQLLRKVASGGELSRLMLCIKSLVARSMNMPTLIFDEIDSGISGEAARQVGMIMKELAGARQVICITHQPQIAGKADAHYLVYKAVKNDAITTGIRVLDTDERIVAIAKMLSGEKPTAAALENAREMVMN